jgi:5'-phosphate synthase pdxT subunit
LLGEKQFKGVFIRAPVIKDYASNVEVLARLNDKVVAVKQGNIIGTSFHPECIRRLWYIQITRSIGEG